MGKALIFIASDHLAKAVGDVAEQVGVTKTDVLRRIIEKNMQPHLLNELYPTHSGYIRISKP